MKYRIIHIEHAIDVLARTRWLQEEGKDVTIFLCKKVHEPSAKWNEFHYKVYRLHEEQLDGAVNLKVNGNLRNYLQEKDVINLANCFESLWKQKQEKNNTGHEFMISTEDNANSGTKLMDADNAKPEQSSPSMLPRKCSQSLTAYYSLYRSRKDEDCLASNKKDEQEEKLGDNERFFASMIFND